MKGLCQGSLLFVSKLLIGQSMFTMASHAKWQEMLEGKQSTLKRKNIAIEILV